MLAFVNKKIKNEKAETRARVVRCLAEVLTSPYRGTTDGSVVDPLLELLQHALESPDLDSLDYVEDTNSFAKEASDHPILRPFITASFFCLAAGAVADGEQATCLLNVGLELQWRVAKHLLGPREASACFAVRMDGDLVPRDPHGKLTMTGAQIGAFIEAMGNGASKLVREEDADAAAFQAVATAMAELGSDVSKEAAVAALAPNGSWLGTYMRSSSTHNLTRIVTENLYVGGMSPSQLRDLVW